MARDRPLAGIYLLGARGGQQGGAVVVGEYAPGGTSSIIVYVCDRAVLSGGGGECQGGFGINVQGRAMNDGVWLFGS